MAIVGVIRFNDNSGCICADQNSWFLRNRKSFFSDGIYSCVSEEDGEKLGIEVIMGGVGYPSFHYEVAENIKKEMKKYLQNNEGNQISLRVEALCRIGMKAFHKVHRRKINNRINFLFGFNTDDFNGELYKKNGITYPIKQEKVKKRVEKIIDMKEKGHSPNLIIPDNEACIIGISPQDGFHAYCIKEKDGVLSYYSCGFDCLGVGKYSGASEFANTMNSVTVEQRRKGYGKEEGLLTVINSILEGWDHYSQIGGNINLVVLDSEGKTREERIKEITDCEGYICVETVRAYRANILSKKDTIRIITAVIFEGLPWQKGERLLFEKTGDINSLDRCLRGYKVNAGREKITVGIENFYNDDISEKIAEDINTVIMSEA